MKSVPKKTPAQQVDGLRRSAADDVYETVKRDIAEFRMIPGDRFTESALSLRLKVSRTPVRQSLYRLQQEGYVEVQFRSGWRVLPFDFEKFEQLYDLRILLEVAAVGRLCDASMVRSPSGQDLIDGLAAIWLVPAAGRSSDAAQVSQWDEAFHCTLVEASGNNEIARVHRDVTDRIRILRRLDFTKQGRIDATYDEHSKILQAVQRQRADQATLLLRTHIETSQAEVRKITLHEVFMARQGK
jgi:DNA-binding GntR family transcriptional regulator